MAQRFKYSSERVKQRKISGILMGCVVSVVVPVYTAVADPEMLAEIGVEGTLLFFAFFFVGSTLSFTIVTTLAARKWRDVEVHLLKDGIERHSNRAIDKIAYESINRLVVGGDRLGKTVYVRLYTPVTAMHLSGLDRTDQVSRSLYRRVSETVEREEKRIWLDWSNPVTSTLVAGLPTALIAGLVFGFAERAGGSLSDIISGALLFAAGAWFLFFHPVSKGWSFRYKRYETVMGILVILIGILHLITVWLW